MPIAQPYSVVTQGLGGGLYVTQGYSVGDIGITIDPVVGVTAALGTIVYTASVAASWSVTGGSIVAAGDNLSATWTAPAGVGTYTITGTDLSNPGNIGHAYGVVQAAGIVGGSFTFTGGTGNLIDTARTGAYGVVASGGGGGSPVLLDGLIGWALTGGPQQTLSSAGVVASGACDFTADPLVSYSSTNGAVLDTDYTFQALIVNHASLDIVGKSFFIHYIAKRINSGNPADASLLFCAGGFYDVNQFSHTPSWGLGGDTKMVIYTADSNPDISGEPGVSSGPFALSVWSDTIAGVNGVANVPGSQDTKSLTAPWNNYGATVPGLYVGIGGGGHPINVYVKYIRIWIGSNASVIAQNATTRAWLDNNGAGRTDAEVAAYTGA